MDESDSLDYELDINNRSPFPDKCIDEIVGIEELFLCFMNRYNACPAFFIGSLQDACQKAFNSLRIQEHCPILVYIHHDKALLSNIFCMNIFCSEILIDYLLNNYIVWPWDITYESNRNRLIQIWKDIFPNESLLKEFSIEQCPMLIGIIKRSSKLEFIPLLKGNNLIRTQEQFNRKIVLNELSIFREEIEALSYEWIPRSGFDEKIIIEICKYLSLNDAIKLFSSRILIYLKQLNTKVHITEPSEILFKMIRGRIQSEQIVSIYLNTDEYWIVPYFSMFNQVISLTLIDLKILEQITEYQIYFPKLICLSLRYNYEIGFNVIKNIFQNLSNSIQRFEIHCTRVLCTHYDNIKQLIMQHEINYHIKYFLLDIGYYPLISTEECFQHYETCFLITTINLMKYMINLEYFHLIINQYDVDKLLDMDTWIELFYYCYRLKKVTLQILGNLSEDQLLSQKIIEIQNQWRQLKRSIKFEVISN